MHDKVVMQRYHLPYALSCMHFMTFNLDKRSFLKVIYKKEGYVEAVAYAYSEL